MNPKILLVLLLCAVLRPSSAATAVLSKRSSVNVRYIDCNDISLKFQLQLTNTPFRCNDEPQGRQIQPACGKPVKVSKCCQPGCCYISHLGVCWRVEGQACAETC